MIIASRVASANRHLAPSAVERVERVRARADDFLLSFYSRRSRPVLGGGRGGDGFSRAYLVAYPLIRTLDGASKAESRRVSAGGRHSMFLTPLKSGGDQTNNSEANVASKRVSERTNFPPRAPNNRNWRVPLWVGRTDNGGKWL